MESEGKGGSRSMAQRGDVELCKDTLGKVGTEVLVNCVMGVMIDDNQIRDGIMIFHPRKIDD